jgi:O-antigen/teichoic acid export membrane protein
MYFHKIDFKSILLLAKTYKNFPKINSLHALITSFTANLPVIIIEKFFSPYAAGLYMLCMRVVYNPISLISASMSQVINPHMAEMYNAKDNIERFMKNIIKKVIMFSGPPFILVIAFATIIFGIIFGDVWTEAGRYFQLMSPFFMMSLLTSPFSFIPMIVNLQKKAFYIELIYLVLRLIGLFIGVYFMSIEMALILYSLSGILILSYNLNWYLSIARRTLKDRTVVV